MQEAGVEFVPTLIVGPSPAAGDPRWIEEARALAALPGAASICVSDGAGHLSPAAPGEPRAAGRRGHRPPGRGAGAGARRPRRRCRPRPRWGREPRRCRPRPARWRWCRRAPRPRRCGPPWWAAAGRSTASRRRSTAPPGWWARCSRPTGCARRRPPSSAPRWRCRRRSRPGSSRASGASGCRAAWWRWRPSPPPSRATSAPRRSPTRSAARVLAQAARHVIDGRRWAEIEPELAQVALGRAGRLRGPVADERARGGGRPPTRDRRRCATWRPWPRRRRTGSPRRTWCCGRCSPRPPSRSSLGAARWGPRPPTGPASRRSTATCSRPWSTWSRPPTRPR